MKPQSAMMTAVRDDSLMPSWMPAVARRYVNPVQGLWAPWLPPWAMIVHTGRVSGAEHRTPVLAFVSESTLAVILFYGSRTQWVRNVVAAGGGEVVRGGRRRRFANVRILRDPPGEPLPWPARVAVRRLPVLAVDVL